MTAKCSCGDCSTADHFGHEYSFSASSKIIFLIVGSNELNRCVADFLGWWCVSFLYAIAQKLQDARSWRFGVVVSALVSINEVNLRRARLVLGWVTVSGVQSSVPENLSQYITSHPGQLSLAIPPCIGAMSTSQRAVIPCGWGVKAGMVCVWAAGKTVWSSCYHRPYLSDYFTLLYLVEICLASALWWCVDDAQNLIIWVSKDILVSSLSFVFCFSPCVRHVVFQLLLLL